MALIVVKAAHSTVRERLAEAGCAFVHQGRGYPDSRRSLHAAKPFTVPVEIDSRHTANAVLRDAGMPKAF